MKSFINVEDIGPLDKALAMIQEGSGTQFDPKCVEVFMDSIPEVKVILNKYNIFV